MSDYITRNSKLQLRIIVDIVCIENVFRNTITFIFVETVLCYSRAQLQWRNKV